MGDIGEETVFHFLQFLILFHLHSLAIPLHLPADDPEDSTADKQQVTQLSPPGGPERRLYDDKEFDGPLAPLLIKASRKYLEFILARSQIGIAHLANTILRTTFHPISIDSFQPIFIIGMARHVKIQTREINRDKVLIISQHDPSCRRQGFLQQDSSVQFFTRQYLLFIHKEGSENWVA